MLRYILIAVAYLLFPFDILPDIIKPLGYLDDLLVIGYLVWRYYRKFRSYRGDQFGAYDRGADYRSDEAAEANSRTGSDSSAKGDAEDTFNPYRVLNLDPSTDAAEIEKRYKKLASQYHPDKVAHLGEELQQVAHKKMVELQRAYEILKGK